MQFVYLNHDYDSVHTQCGLFNITNTGILLLRGENVKDQLQSLVPTDLHRIGPGESCQTVILNENGGIQNRAVVHDRGQINQIRELILTINAPCITTQIAFLWDRLKSDHTIMISDLRKDYLHFAVEGPMAKTYMQKITENPIVSSMVPYSNMILTLNGISDSIAFGASIFLIRVSTIGEDGFQLILKRDIGIALWKHLICIGCKVCGLAIWDILRLENHIQLCGSELDQITSPIEAALSHLVHLETPENFLGRQMLETQAAAYIYYQLVGLIIDGYTIPNHYCCIFDGSQQVGQITSGSWSPRFSRPIALGYILAETVKRKQTVTICITNKHYIARIIKIPLYELG